MRATEGERNQEEKLKFWNSDSSIKKLPSPLTKITNKQKTSRRRQKGANLNHTTGDQMISLEYVTPIITRSTHCGSHYMTEISNFLFSLSFSIFLSLYHPKFVFSHTRTQKSSKIASKSDSKEEINLRDNLQDYQYSTGSEVTG